jgi:hypothetical protein
MYHKRISILIQYSLFYQNYFKYIPKHISFSTNLAHILRSNFGFLFKEIRNALCLLITNIFCRWGSEAIVKFILRKKGCEARQILDSGDRLGRTPLHYAASQKTGLTYITNLLKAGANIHAQAGFLPTCLSAPYLHLCSLLAFLLPTCLSAPYMQLCFLPTCLSAPCLHLCSLLVFLLPTCLSAPFPPLCSIPASLLRTCLFGSCLPLSSLPSSLLPSCLSALYLPLCSLLAIWSLPFSIFLTILSAPYMQLCFLPTCLSAPYLLLCSLPASLLPTCLSAP